MGYYPSSGPQPALGPVQKSAAVSHGTSHGGWEQRAGCTQGPAPRMHHASDATPKSKPSVPLAGMAQLISSQFDELYTRLLTTAESPSAPATTWSSSPILHNSRHMCLASGVSHCAHCVHTAPPALQSRTLALNASEETRETLKALTDPPTPVLRTQNSATGTTQQQCGGSVGDSNGGEQPSTSVSVAALMPAQPKPRKRKRRSRLSSRRRPPIRLQDIEAAEQEIRAWETSNGDGDGEQICCICHLTTEIGAGAGPDEGGGVTPARDARAQLQPCKHVFHQHCIEPWLDLQSTCPLCRDRVIFKLLEGEARHRPVPFRNEKLHQEDLFDPYESLVCVRCHQGDNEQLLLICDNCDRGYHTYCVDLERVPLSDWYCPSCTEQLGAHEQARSTRPQRHMRHSTRTRSASIRVESG